MGHPAHRVNGELPLAVGERFAQPCEHPEHLMRLTLCDDGSLDTVIEGYCEGCRREIGELRFSLGAVDRDDDGSITRESWEWLRGEAGEALAVAS